MCVCGGGVCCFMRVVREGREHLIANGFVSRSKGGDGINHTETWGKSIL